MANRYWVLGTGTWDATTTTNWSTTSGGSGGASVPTVSDDVFFNASSGGGTVTITLVGYHCKSFDSTGYTGTIGGTAPSFNPYGSFIIGSGVTWSFAGAILPRASVAGTYTIQTNGKTIGELATVPSTGVIYNIVGNITVTGNIQFTADGTINTNNYSVTSGEQILFSGYTLSTIYNLGTSVITCRRYQVNSATSGTVNSSSASVILTGTAPHYVYLYGTTLGSLTCTNVGDCYLMTTGTVGSLTYTSASSFSASNLLFMANFTISGTLSVTNTGGSYTVVKSDTAGTQRTVTAGTVALSNIEFTDINAAGASIPWTGTGFLNGGNNANITFPKAANSLFYGSNF